MKWRILTSLKVPIPGTLWVPPDTYMFHMPVFDYRRCRAGLEIIFQNREIVVDGSRQGIGGGKDGDASKYQKNHEALHKG
jgi:hypothetical protein